MRRKRIVAIQVDSDIAVPLWVLEAKAKGQLTKMLMAKQNPDLGTIGMQDLQHLHANHKVEGTLVVPPRPGDDEPNYLIIPSLGAITKDELEYTANLVREAGYGHKPVHKSKQISRNEWKRMVENTIDRRLEQRRKAQTNAISVAI